MSGSFGLPGVISSIVRPGVVINLRDGKGVFLGGETRAEGLKAFKEITEEYVLRYPGRRHYRPAGGGGGNNRLGLASGGTAGGGGGPDPYLPGAGGTPPKEGAKGTAAEGQVTPPVTVKKATPEEIKAFMLANPDAVQVRDDLALKVDFSAIGSVDEIDDVIKVMSKLREGSIDEARRGVIHDTALRDLAAAIGDFGFLQDDSLSREEQSKIYLQEWDLVRLDGSPVFKITDEGKIKVIPAAP